LGLGILVGRPAYLLFPPVMVALWIGANGLGPRIGWMSPLDSAAIRVAARIPDACRRDNATVVVILAESVFCPTR